ARRRLASQVPPGPLAQGRVDLLPDAVVAPDPKVVKGRLPGRQVVGQSPPLVAPAHHVQNRIDDLAPAVARWAATGLDGGHERLQDRPLGVAQVARIGFADGGCWFHVASLPHLYPFKTVSKALTALLLAREPTLRLLEVFLCRAVVTRILHTLPIRSDQEHLQADINPGLATSQWHWV